MLRLLKSVLILVLCLLTFATSSPALGSTPQPPSESGLDSISSTSHQAVPSNAIIGSTYIKTFTGHDFRPRSSKCGFEYESGGAIYANLLDTNIENNVFIVNLDLPNGAIVNKVTFFFVDNSATYNIFLFLTSYGVNKTYTHMIADSTAGFSSSMAVQSWTWSGTPFTISSNLSYSLRMVPYVATTAHQIIGVKVEYSFAGLALPIVLK